jgi:hypothetical protein
LDGRYACYFGYHVPSNTLFLLNDASTAFLPGLPLSGAGSRSNSQCTINAAGSFATINGNILALVVNITFKVQFAGNKVIYQSAQDTAGGTSGWIQQGVWNVPGGPATPLAVVSMSPTRGIGSGGPFTFTFRDTNGYHQLQSVTVLLNDYLTGVGACYAGYHRPSNTVFLLNDTSTAFMPGLLLAGAGSVENSQCRIAGAGSSAVGSGNTLTLTLNITLKPHFAGNRVFCLSAQDASTTSGWQAMGTYTVQ